MVKSISYSAKEENDAWGLYKKELEKLKESTLVKKDDKKRKIKK